MRTFRVAAVLLSVAALIGGCSSGNSTTTAAPEARKLATSADKAILVKSLLNIEDVWSVTARTGTPELNEVGTQDMAAKEVAAAAQQANKSPAEIGQKQPLPGVTWSPSECSEMMEAGVYDLSQVQGSVRLWTTKQTTELAAGGVRSGITSNAVLYTPQKNYNIDKVRAKVQRCAKAQVTLDTVGGVVGKITSYEISAPKIDGADSVFAWRQEVSFDKLPAGAEGLAALFNAEAVYMTKGNFMVWTAHGGTPGLTGVQLAPAAFRHAMDTLSTTK